MFYTTVSACLHRANVITALGSSFVSVVLSIPCVASSAITWVNLPSVGGQLTRMYQVRQWACNGHSAHGRTSMLQYRLESSTRLTLSSLSGTIPGLQWKGRSLFQFLPDSSVSHLNSGSRSYDIGYVGHL